MPAQVSETNPTNTTFEISCNGAHYEATVITSSSGGVETVLFCFYGEKDNPPQLMAEQFFDCVVKPFLAYHLTGPLTPKDRVSPKDSRSMVKYEASAGDSHDRSDVNVWANGQHPSLSNFREKFEEFELRSSATNVITFKSRS